MIEWSGVDERRMMNAIIDGDHYTIRTLVEEGRSLNEVPKSENYAYLWYACVQENSLETIQLLLALGADPNAFHPTCNYTPLRALLETRHYFGIQALLDAGADPNAVCSTKSGTIHMHLAAQHGTPDILEAMIAAGGNPFIKNNNNLNSLDFALHNLNRWTPKKWECDNVRYLVKIGVPLSEELIRPKFGEFYDQLKSHIDAWRMEALTEEIPLTAGGLKRATM